MCKGYVSPSFELVRHDLLCKAQKYTTKLGGSQSERDVWDGFNLNAEQLVALKDLISAHKGKHAQLLQEYPELRVIISRMNNVYEQAVADHSQPIRVAVTGAAGQIGYALLYRIAWYELVSLSYFLPDLVETSLAPRLLYSSSFLNFLKLKMP